LRVEKLRQKSGVHVGWGPLYHRLLVVIFEKTHPNQENPRL